MVVVTKITPRCGRKIIVNRLPIRYGAGRAEEDEVTHDRAEQGAREFSHNRLEAVDPTRESARLQYEVLDGPEGMWGDEQTGWKLYEEYSPAEVGRRMEKHRARAP